MTKAFFKYLLTISILLSGYSQMSAQPYKHASDLTKKSIQKTRVSVEDEKAREASFKYIIDTERYDYRLDLSFFENEEKEDDEFVSLKKCPANSVYITSVFFVPVTEYFLSCNKTSPFDRYSSYISSYRYLTLKVFRI